MPRLVLLLGSSQQSQVATATGCMVNLTMVNRIQGHLIQLSYPNTSKLHKKRGRVTELATEAREDDDDEQRVKRRRTVVAHVEASDEEPEKSRKIRTWPICNYWTNHRQKPIPLNF